MMLSAHGSSKQTCTLLAVSCGNASRVQKTKLSDCRPRYPFPELVSSGRLEVRTLSNPTVEDFKSSLKSLAPNFVYLQGEKLLNEDEIGPIIWQGVKMSTPEVIADMFSPSIPSTVYLEVPNGEKLAEALRSRGIPYIIYWRTVFSCYAAAHFCQALLSVMQSSSSHTWDAFELARASFRFYCLRNIQNMQLKNQNFVDNSEPHMLGEPPKVNVVSFEKAQGNDEASSPGSVSDVKIYDDDVNMKLLVCGFPCTLDAFLLDSLVNGINSLLNIEMRGSKLHNRVSAPPPPLQVGTFTRGVVTMKCDVSTCNSAHVSLLVSGSAQTCFDDQALEAHIKNELVEKIQLVNGLPDSEQSNLSLAVPRNSSSIACGASVFQICVKIPTWASQVLRQLATEVTYRNLVALGIASIQGTTVAAFEKVDAERLLFFCRGQQKHPSVESSVFCSLPSWFKIPAPRGTRSELFQDAMPITVEDQGGYQNIDEERIIHARLVEERKMAVMPACQKRKVAAMRPVPHIKQHRMLPFLGAPEMERHEPGLGTANLASVPTAKQSVGSSPVTHRKAMPTSYQPQHIISLNPLPLKKHGCGRSPIQACSEEEFLRDVMQFLILRGHTRLIPQGGLAEFPDAILNAKRLDLYNLYREVVSRGGFHVGNGINWKGQVFSKMRNHTLTNKMTGVGNTLKRHYETYLLEYELAHDDVDGECCLLCHSSAAGDWVNCGVCGEWAHFGCDRRQGLGTFKDYAKTDGLEYICPHCSNTAVRKKTQKTSNGFLQPAVSRNL